MDAASEMMAKSLAPFMKSSFSAMLTIFCVSSSRRAYASKVCQGVSSSSRGKHQWHSTGLLYGRVVLVKNTAGRLNT